MDKKKFGNEKYEDVISTADELDISEKKQVFNKSNLQKNKILLYEGQDEAINDSKETFKLTVFTLFLTWE